MQGVSMLQNHRFEEGQFLFEGVGVESGCGVEVVGKFLFALRQFLLQVVAGVVFEDEFPL